jgi:hypothetical protein
MLCGSVRFATSAQQMISVGRGSVGFHTSTLSVMLILGYNRTYLPELNAANVGQTQSLRNIWMVLCVVPLISLVIVGVIILLKVNHGHIASTRKSAEESDVET